MTDYLETKKRKLNIDINHVIPDELHLLLRISDRLIENLINAAVHYDHVNNAPTSRILNGPMLHCLIRKINSCGITFDIIIIILPIVNSLDKREFT